jgi:hypothetical protein
MHLNVYNIFYSPNSHQYVQGDNQYYYKTTKVQIMLCCVAATPSKLKIIMISVQNT